VAKYKRIFSNRQLPVKLRILVYKTYVRPHFDYASEIWWTNSKQATRLEAIQMKVLRSILQCNARTNNEAVRAVLGVVPLKLRRQRFKLMWFAKALVEPKESLVASLPSCFTWGKRRGRAKQAANWFSQLKAGADSLGDALDDGEKCLLRQMRDQSSKLRTKALRKRKSLRKDKAIGFISKWNWKLKALHLKRAHLDFVLASTVQPRLRILRLVVPHRRNILSGLDGRLQGAKLVKLRLLMGTSALHCDLSKYNCDISSDCPCCEDGEETLEHFLLKCPFFVDIRTRWCQELRGSAWGYVHWKSAYSEADDESKCALLLGYPVTRVNPSKEGPFPLDMTLAFMKEMYEARSKKLESLSSDEEIDLTGGQTTLKDYFKSPNAKGRGEASCRSNRKNVSPSPSLKGLEIIPTADKSASSKDSNLAGGQSGQSNVVVRVVGGGQGSPSRAGFLGLTPSQNA
jgi:hypothetical protein